MKCGHDIREVFAHGEFATYARVVSACLVFVGISLLPDPVRASDASEPDWIPSLAVGYEAGRFETNSRYGHSLGPSASEVPSQGTDDGRFNSSILGLEAELLGPVWVDWIGAPRLFVRGAVKFIPSGGDEETVLDIGDVGPLIGEEPRGSLAPPIVISNIQGQGIRTVAQIEAPMWSASFGVAFTTPLPGTDDTLLRIRPSIEYDYQELEIEQSFAAAADLGVGPPAPQCLNDLRPPELIPFSCHSSSASSRQTEHRLGPGLELELVFSQNNPVQVSAFVGARFLFLVSDDTFGLADSQGLATSSIERDGFGIRGRGGFRVSWVGWAK